ncbi:MAG TPA: winged helix-turn-helix domain-containing protein [Myxococcota bacterium]|nr:winged helix-turn-helix domain-containing protein [Myxococcota bacterium]
MSESPQGARPARDARDWVERPPLTLVGGTIDFARSRFLRGDGEVVQLSARESQVLAYLADRPNQIVTRDALLEDVFAYSALTTSRALDTCISRLRKKIEADPDLPEMLFTAHGEGYRLFTGTHETAHEPARAAPPVAKERLVLRVGELDLGAGHVFREGERVALTEQERQLLGLLWRERGRAVESRELARKATLASPGAVKNAVFRLRKKLERDPSSPDHLQSVSGGAYRFVCEERPVLDRSEHLAALRSLTDYLGLVLSLPDCVAYVREGDVLVQTVAFGVKRDGSAVKLPMRQAVGEGLVGAAAASGDPIVCPEVSAEPRYVPDPAGLPTTRSELTVPVFLRSRLVGVIDLEHPAPNAFGSSHLSTLISLAAIAAPAFANLESRR